MDKKYWFRKKRSGLGWYPVTWEGWAVTLGTLVGPILVIKWIVATYPDPSNALPYIFGTVVATAVVVLLICNATAEP